MRYRQLILAAAMAAAIGVAGCEQDSPTSPSPAPCSFALSATSQSFTSDGGNSAVAVTTQSHCSWTAATTAAWIAVQGATSGTGTGTVNVVIAANASEQSRAAAIVIAGQTLAISQEGLAPCTFDVAPATATFVADGGSGTLHVTTAGACTWDAETTVAWVTITSGAHGQGEGDVAFTVGRNPETKGRSGVIVAAGRQVTIEQEGAKPSPPQPPVPTVCEYSVSPVEFVLHWHHTGGDVALTTAAGCAWTVTAGDDWLSIPTPGSGSGPAAIRFANGIFTADASRRAPVQVRWPTPTAGQNVWVTQEGCRYGISETARDVPVAGGTVTMYVVTQAVSPSCAIGCPWTATPTVPWIHVVTSMPHAGDDQLVYRVDANTTGQARLGQLRIESQTVTVRQAAEAPLWVEPVPAGALPLWDFPREEWFSPRR